jgi:hypothetical protein
MKISLFAACAAALLMNACGDKEVPKPPPRPVPAMPKVAEPAVIPGGAMSDEDKAKAMDAAKAAAKSAGGRGD